MRRTCVGTLAGKAYELMYIIREQPPYLDSAKLTASTIIFPQ